MTTHRSTTVEGLLLAADRLLEGPLTTGATASGRHRGICLALRTAIELHVNLVLEARTPGLSRTTGRAKLLILYSCTAAGTARRTKALWSQLSLGCHYHRYELGPTHDQVRGWRREVDSLIQELSHAAPAAPG
ncbi:hypothetical protein ACFY00_33475 [Kitasatospora sp. NPDC001540]|uniref:hypothetical protein n=1 Tax=Kitasatospora sp. NPDC001540 TaxID=3364014 RepID=UPI003696705C